jgi:hypothetical protein
MTAPHRIETPATVDALLPVLARLDSTLGPGAPVLLRVVRGDGTAWTGWLSAVEIDWVSGQVDLVTGCER